MKPEVLVRFDVMGNRHGHKSKAITVEDDPKRREELAEHVTALIRGGFVVQLSDGTKVEGYEASSNSWLVREGEKLIATSAKNRPATATPLPSGG